MGSAYWEWQAPPDCPHRILVSREAWEALEAVFRVSGASQDPVGGLLLGSSTPAGNGMMIVVEAIVADPRPAVEAPDYAPSEELLASAREGTAGSCVGWFHTHPGEGIYFSESDQEVQRERFPGLSQVALVCDPLREEATFYYWASLGRLGPVTRPDAKGVFHPWKRHPPKLPRRPLESRPIAILVGTLLALAGLALGAHAVYPRLSMALEQRTPPQVSVEGQAFLVSFPEDNLYYQITRSGGRPQRPFTEKATDSVLRIPFSDFLARGLTGPNVLWYGDRPGSGRIDQVELPEVRLSGSPPRPGEWVFRAEGLTLVTEPLTPGAYWVVEEERLDAWSRRPNEGLPARRLEVYAP